jgi:hypothetical protein
MSSFQETKSFLASRPLSTLTAARRAPFTVAKWHRVSDALEVSSSSAWSLLSTGTRIRAIRGLRGA